MSAVRHYWVVTFETAATSSTARFITVDDAFRYLRERLDTYLERLEEGGASEGYALQINSSVSYERVPSA
jgi:hypothetical protein